MKGEERKRREGNPGAGPESALSVLTSGLTRAEKPFPATAGQSQTLCGKVRLVPLCVIDLCDDQMEGDGKKGWAANTDTHFTVTH